MDCEQVQSELLAADDLEAPDGVLARVEKHVAGCATCSELVRKLRRLNSTVRSLPAPVEMLAGRARFEDRFAEKLAANPTRKQRLIITPSRWVAVAATVLLVTGVGIWTYSYSEHRAAASTLALQQAVDWNLTLSQSDSDPERQKLYAQGAQELQNAPWASEDRPIADDLLQGGKFLADHHDPIAQAEHFTQVADLLVGRMDHAAHRHPKTLQPLGDTYLDVVNLGIRRNLDIAANSSADSPEKRRRIERIIQHNLQLQAKLKALLRDRPDSATVRQRLDMAEHHLHRLLKQQKSASQSTGHSSQPLDHQIH